ncbi:MAG TPA: adenylate/guanylate cyclase domain-containing protein, partial [Nitrososphaera sp.]|nr:adenylate/guanylate cyclase domain-containing protein [Nitrososphaera sp.]
KEVRTMFSSYVSPRIDNELIKDPQKAHLGGQRKELTMLFSDIVGFTSFSEQRTAEEVVAQLNEYLGAMAEVVFRWNGTLDKFVGDAIVVFWGAPLDQPDHAELAVKCALHMRQRLEELHKKWLAEGKYPLDMGIGINSGEVLVGNMGAEGRKMDYTMIGDQVNLASRVEGLTRKFKAPIVITEHTLKHIQPLLAAEDTEANKERLRHLLIRGFGVVLVKGREKHVLAHAVESLSLDEPSRIEEAPASSLEV